MNDYISREAAFDAAQQSISDKRTHDFNAGCARAANNILALPAADVREVVRGHWEGVDSSYWKWYPEGARAVERITYRCSRCTKGSAIKTNFCPNCGADMRPKGEQDNA